MYVKKNQLKKTLVSQDLKVKDVIKSLNKSGLQIALIINKKNKMIGTVTDGDIRRGLINGLNVNSLIHKIINKKFVTSNYKLSSEKAETILKKFEISHIPILSNKEPVEMYYKGAFNHRVQKIPNKVIIMAGGFGKRLGKLTKKIPKAMLKIDNKPILEHIIEKLKREGIYNIYISVFYLKNQIKKYFNSGKKFGVNIKYIEEKNPLGTIGCLKLLKKKFEDSFFVINCDVITNLNFAEMLKFHKKKKAKLSIATINHQYFNPYGVITSNKNNFVKFEEKPTINFNINSGIYLLHQNLIDEVKVNKFKEIPDLINHIKRKKFKIKTYPMFESWDDYGTQKRKLKI